MSLAAPPKAVRSKAAHGKAARSKAVRRRPVRRGAVVAVAVGCAVVLLVGVLLTRLSAPRPVAAWTPVAALAGAQPFAVLAGGTVRASGTSSITGDVGGASVDGLDGQVGGTVWTGDDIAHPLADLSAADDTLTARPATGKPTAIEGRLGPGTYAFSDDVEVAGPVVLDAGGDADAVFVIRSGSTISTADDADVTLAGGARACNVFWLATDSATLGGTVVGNVVARDRITAGARSTVTGRLLSRGGDVRLDTATVRTPTDCTSDTATAPEPATTPGTAAAPATPRVEAAAPDAAGEPGPGAPGGTGQDVSSSSGAHASGGTPAAPRRAAPSGTGAAADDHAARASHAATDRSSAGRDTGTSRAAARPERATTPDTDDARTGGAGAGGPGDQTGSVADDDEVGDPPSLRDRIRGATGVGVGFGSG